MIRSSRQYGTNGKERIVLQPRAYGRPLGTARPPLVVQSHVEAAREVMANAEHDNVGVSSGAHCEVLMRDAIRCN